MSKKVRFCVFDPDTPANGQLSVRDVIAEYLAQKRAECSAGCYTLAALRKATSYLDSFERAFGFRSLPECRRSDVTNWILANPQWQSPHSKSDAIAAVSGCFRWAVDDGLIGANPYPRPKRTGWEVPGPREAMTVEEYRRVMLAAKRRDGRGARASPSRHAFRFSLLFLRVAGARTCEMREADWTGLAWTDGVLVVRKHKTRKVSPEDRLVPLHRPLLRLLVCLWHVRGRPTSGRIFLNGRGRPWTKTSFAKLFRRFADLAGVRKEVSPYSLRHCFACEKLARGMTERQVADLLGHTSTRLVAQWYGRSLRRRAAYLRSLTDPTKRKGLYLP